MNSPAASTPRATPAALAFVLALIAGGCGAGVAPDPGADAATSATSDAAPVTPDAAPDACEPGPAPGGVAPLASRYVILGAGEAFPEPTGGDAAGRWVVRRVTLYMPAQAQGRVNPETSTIMGTGWASFEAGRFAISLDLSMRVVTTAVGPVRQGVNVASMGQFTPAGARLTLAPTCTRGSQRVDELGFTRDDDAHGRIFVAIPGDAMRGASVMVLDVERGS